MKYAGKNSLMLEESDQAKRSTLGTNRDLKEEKKIVDTEENIPREVENHFVLHLQRRNRRARPTKRSHIPK